MSRERSNLALAALLALPALASCGGQASRPASRSAEPVPVVVETLRPAAHRALYEAIGTVRARNTARISSRIAASIREVRADVGQEVRAGQILVQLDDRDLAADLESAEAAREEGQQSVEESAHALAAAEADLHLAHLTHERFATLLARKSVSQHEYDQVAARLQSAEAGRALAQAR